MEIILKKGVAIKLSIQLASSLNLIWKSVVALAILVRLVDENFSRYFIVLKYITNFTFGKTKRYT